MSDESIYTFDVVSDFEPLAADAIALSSEAMDSALALAQRSPQTETQWQIYLTALALNGFEQWLHDRASDLTVERTQCTILSPPVADATAAACNLQVNGFRLCLIGTERVFDGTIAMPQVALDSPDWAAHFYVPVEVYEEQAHILIHGFLRYDQWQQHQAQSPQWAGDGTYHLPIAWFETDVNRLLLHLSCLEPSAIALPVAPATPLNRPTTTGPLRQLLVQPAIGIGRWLRQQWDDVTQDLSGFLTPLELAGAMRGGQDTGMRSPATDLDTILTTLRRAGRTIPAHIQGMYRDWTFAKAPLRLYVATAPLGVEIQTAEWSILIILTRQDRLNLTSGIRLQVSDGHRLIGEQVLTEATTADYLYLTAIGSLEEQFIVTIALADGTAITLPPFSY
ncbi:MAG: DUF1822 family protein [Kovacikia sp.]